VEEGTSGEKPLLLSRLVELYHPHRPERAEEEPEGLAFRLLDLVVSML
jgi:hypothetical protein